jgi:hypothetical protein
MTDAPPTKQTRRRDLATQGDAIQLIEHRACDRCGERFMPRTGSGGSAQRFCSADCRLSFHTERLRAQRTGLYAGQLQQHATQAVPSLALLEQAERLIAKLIRLLASPVDRKVVAAVRALLDSAGIDHLADVVEANWRPPPEPKLKHDWQIRAAHLLRYLEILRGDRELDFLQNMRRSRTAPTEKQWKRLGSIEARLPSEQRRDCNGDE